MMATNFLIALATAFGSATVILLVLRIILKVFAPNAFKEMIAVPLRIKISDEDAVIIPRAAPEEVPKPVTLRQTRLNILEHGSERGVIIHSIHLDSQQQLLDLTKSAALSGLEIVGRWRRDAQAEPSIVLVKNRVTVEKEKKKALSPPGQLIISNLGATAQTKSSTGVPNETLCGSVS
jgi:hypothetical protein